MVKCFSTTLFQGERVELLNERSEFSNSGEGTGAVVLIFSTRSRSAPAIVSKTNTTAP